MRVALALALMLAAGPAATSGITVPGTANPWLAGMPPAPPDATRDAVPAHAPVLVDMPLRPGMVLMFAAKGAVSHTGAQARGTPDGTFIIHHRPGDKNGIARTAAPINALMGVFLGPDRPDTEAPPPGLLFLDRAQQQYTEVRPRPRQVFFIGDGFTHDGQQQRVVVPEGAARLFLGTMDGFGWFNNSGQISVNVTQDK